MKAVVLETKDGFCAVLKDDGTVEKIRMAAEVGQEIEMPEVQVKPGRVRRFPLRYVATAASVALVAVCSGYLSFIQDYSFVSVDVDASVEYSLNRMDRVVTVSAVDEDGKILADSVKKEGVKGDTLDEAVNKTANVLQRDGYVEKEDDVVLVAVSSKSKKKRAKLKKKVEDKLVEDKVSSTVESVSIEEREQAKESGLSTPRYAVVKNIVGEENLDEATIEVAKSKSTNELLLMAEESEELVAEEETKADEATAEEEVEVCEEIHEDEPEEEVVLEPEAAEDAEAEEEEKTDSEDVSEDEALASEEDGKEEVSPADDSSTEPVPAAPIENVEPAQEVLPHSFSPSTVPIDAPAAEPTGSVSSEEPAEPMNFTEAEVSAEEIIAPADEVVVELGSPVEP